MLTEVADGLSACAVGAAALIVQAPEAVVRADDLDAGGLAELVAAGLAERWPRPDYVGACLTCWGAAVFGVELRERWVGVASEVEVHDLDRPLRVVGVRRTRTLEEVPYWSDGSEDRRPNRLPRCTRVAETLLYPERVEAPAAGPEYWTDEDGEPIRVFGQVVVRERRRKRA